jgi:eukaryotic-like serine/threonine-protein kinase
VTDTGRLSAALAGRYVIEREIGQGGMATVYLAQDVKHHRKVALKVLRPELAATLGVERFLREIEVAANLQHPHILPLFDSGEAEGFLFYVMPYIEGESLRAKLARGGELPVPESAKILRDVVDALSYAHQHGVVHRDIKPDNVLLSGRHALVTDFGVAKAVSEATGRQALTTAGVALGTPMYMAPEQAVADPHVDFRADLYAVGVMAYEMLTGHPPFAGPSAQAILAAHVTEPATPITTIRQSVPAPLGQLVMQCLEKRPADRPGSAEVLLPQLEALATPSGGITPTSTAPLTAARVPVTSQRRIPPWAIAAAAVVIIGGGGYGAYRALHGSGVSAAAQSVAVLPFENVGGDSTNRIFTDGVQDEILTDLTRLGAIQVTSRSSADQYRNSTKGVKEIGTELGVRTLLEGQVQRAGDHVHVDVQLVDASHDRQIWAQSYDRELTAGNVFAIQGDIAQNVAQALQASFTKSQEAAVEKPPTTNLEALDWYHRGQELFASRAGASTDSEAPSAFERAVTLDPDFAEAWAGLAAARSWEVRDGTTTDTAPARAALDRAVALVPSGPSIDIAQAYYAYYAKGDYDAALTHFQAAAAAEPGNAEAIAGVGYIARRQGKWETALDAERRVTVLDPRDADALADLGASYTNLRQFDRAVDVYRRALILDPSDESAVSFLLQALIWGHGDTAAARAVVARIPSGAFPRMRAYVDAGIARWAHHFDTANAALALLAVARPLDPIDYLALTALNERAAGHATRAVQRADSAAKLARAYLGTNTTADVFGNRADYYTVLGIAEAIAGKRADAVRDGERAIQLNPPSRDAFEAPRSAQGLIEIYILLGQDERAIELITQQTNRPLGDMEDFSILPVTRAVIRNDPLYDGLRDDPRIQALLKNDQAWVVR